MDDASLSAVLSSLLKLSSEETHSLVSFLQFRRISGRVFSVGDPSDSCFVLLQGRVDLKLHGQIIAVVEAPNFFGGIGLLDGSARRSDCEVFGEWASVAVVQRSALREHINPSLSLKLLFGVGETVNALLSGDAVYTNLDVLLVLDGGCSPGYNAVTAYLTEEFEKRGRRVAVAATGFKSLVSDQNSDYRILVHDDRIFKLMALAPGVVHAPTLVSRRGAAFRTERFAEFKQPELQQKAAEAIRRRKAKTVVAVGGNGTFAGIEALSKLLDGTQVFFVPVTIDSDIGGTETIGQHTAVEVGAEKIRCYVADAATHDRCYLIELMGRDGGFHALYSAIGGGAHLALLPHSRPDLPLLAKRITDRTSTVVAISEGFDRHARAVAGFTGSAADWLLKQLRATGQLDETKRRVVCEPFSRDVRGASTNNSDLVLAQKFALAVAEMSAQNKTLLMPSVCGSSVSQIPFSKVETDNTVSPEDEKLSNRL